MQLMRLPRLLTLLVAALSLVALTMVGGASAKTTAKSADRNHDRIPDRWETRFHLSLKVNEAKRDQDRDGVDNREEFAARTDARDPDPASAGHKDGGEAAGTVTRFDGTTLTINLFNG